MKNLLKIFILIIASQFIGYFALAGCVCNGSPAGSYATKALCDAAPPDQRCTWTAESNTPGGTVTAPPVKLNNPLTGTASSVEIPTLLGKIINYIMGIVGSLALVMFIYGGLTWMISGGNTEQVTKGKQIIIWATLGIAIIFTAYALVKFVISAISA